MFEDSVSSIPSIWASLNSWFTPAVLFVLLNVMIGTIAFTSTLANKKPHQNPQAQDYPNHQNQQIKLEHSPSLLQRLRSINFYSQRSQEPDTHFESNPDSETHESKISETETQVGFQKTEFEGQREEEEREEEESMTLDQVYSQLQERHVNRTNSDTKPASGEMPERLPAKMRKSASAKSAFGHFSEEDVVEARRPATVREGNCRATETDDDGVDAKADDFINRFKHQLKLQRMDSIVRYKEMISGGGGK